MPHTFEERVGGEIDSLYQGALFLSGGSAPDAERLLVDTMRSAFRAYGSAEVDDDFSRWLEGRLVLRFLEGVEPEDGNEDVGLDGGNGNEEHGAAPLDVAALHAAARRMPPRARATLWLVLLCRWSYEEGAEVLGVDEEGLRELLGYRDVLMTSLAGGATRTDEVEGSARDGRADGTSGDGAGRGLR